MFWKPTGAMPGTYKTKKSRLQAVGFSKKSRNQPAPPLSGRVFKDLLEQGQHGLAGLVGLRQHGGGCLLDDLGLSQFGGLLGVVGIQNTAA